MHVFIKIKASIGNKVFYAVIADCLKTHFGVSSISELNEDFVFDWVKDRIKGTEFEDMNVSVDAIMSKEQYLDYVWSLQTEEIDWDAEFDALCSEEEDKNDFWTNDY